MRPNVVITGVSAGIGLDAARVLVERGYRVFGSVRTQADAERVAAWLWPLSRVLGDRMLDRMLRRAMALS